MLNSITVGQYMAKSLITFSPDTEVKDAITLLLDKKISGAPVVGVEGELLGVFSEGDCLRGGLQDSDLETVGELMSTHVDTVPADVPIMDIADEFVKKGRRRLPVVENGKLVGQISRRDVLRAVKDYMYLY